MLRLAGYSFAFDGKAVLQDLSFSLGAGAYLSIIGPNGAGKSTLLKCLLRLHEEGRAQGLAEVRGKSLAAYPQRELATVMSYVPQAGGWIPPFSVEEFLRLSRYPYAPPAGKLRGADLAAVQRALSLTGMEALASRRLKTLSGGERQKAYLAAALAQETPIMLLDEPASFLDPRHAAELNLLLKTLNREQGLTMLTVTHDLNHPLDAGGNVLVLRRGRQLFFGPAQSLLDNDILETAFGLGFTRLPHPEDGLPIILPRAF